MATLFQDIKFGLRLLLRDRSFTITSILTLAVCIGANAAMFSVVRSVLLKPLPFPGSERVVLLYNRLEGVKAMNEQALFQRGSMTLGDAEGVERLITIRATPSFFKVVPIGA